MTMGTAQPSDFKYVPTKQSWKAKVHLIDSRTGNTYCNKERCPNTGHMTSSNTMPDGREVCLVCKREEEQHLYELGIRRTAWNQGLIGPREA
jgi:hypothetical protein